MALTPTSLQGHTQSLQAMDLHVDLIIARLFPKKPIKTPAHRLRLSFDWWIWTRVQPSHHVLAVCLHTRTLAVCWTETRKERIHLTKNSRTLAEAFPLSLHICRIWNNSFCEKYFCYSKSGRKPHLFLCCRAFVCPEIPNSAPIVLS